MGGVCTEEGLYPETQDVCCLLHIKLEKFSSPEQVNKEDIALRVKVVILSPVQVKSYLSS